MKSQEASHSADSEAADAAHDDTAQVGQRPIWLVGMMGVGKSTIGPMLARHLNRTFVDTDRWIERHAGCRISEIFEVQGEAAFRELEREAIARAEGKRAVVALGGGAMAQPGAAERLCASGLVVYLKATPEQLLRRIEKPESRPLLAGLDPEQRLERLSELLAERERSYQKASVLFDTGPLSMAAVASELARQLRKEGLVR